MTHIMPPEIPYRPGWVDRFTDWVRRLPLPAWLFYPALGLALALLFLALIFAFSGWTSATLPFETVLMFCFLNGLTFAYLLGLVHYLDNSAAAALTRYRPVLTVDEAGYGQLRYRLTTLPARPTLVASGLGVVYTFFTLLLNIVTLGPQSSETMTPAVIALVWTSNLALFVLVAVVVYHSIHQLRMVSEIYTEHTRINLFELGPLYALSGLTARTAIGIGIPTYVWFQVNSSSSMGITAPDLAYTVLLCMMIVVAFIWPLLGAHSLLEREKQRLQDEVARRIEATIARLHAQVDNDALEGRATTLKDTLDGLVTEQGVINKLRTWPWRTETVSGLALAFLIPILIGIVQRLLERLGL